jgi:hypothetical protein
MPQMKLLVILTFLISTSAFALGPMAKDYPGMCRKIYEGNVYNQYTAAKKRFLETQPATLTDRDELAGKQTVSIDYQADPAMSWVNATGPQTNSSSMMLPTAHTWTGHHYIQGAGEVSPEGMTFNVDGISLSEYLHVNLLEVEEYRDRAQIGKSVRSEPVKEYQQTNGPSKISKCAKELALFNNDELVEDAVEEGTTTGEDHGTASALGDADALARKKYRADRDSHQDEEEGSSSPIDPCLEETSDGVGKGCHGAESGLGIATIEGDMAELAKSFDMTTDSCKKCFRKSFETNLQAINDDLGNPSSWFGKELQLELQKKTPPNYVEVFDDMKKKARDRIKDEIFGTKITEELLKLSNIFQDTMHATAKMADPEMAQKVKTELSCSNSAKIREAISKKCGETGKDPTQALDIMKAGYGNLFKDEQVSSVDDIWDNIYSKMEKTTKEDGAKCDLSREAYAKMQRQRFLERGDYSALFTLMGTVLNNKEKMKEMIALPLAMQTAQKSSIAISALASPLTNMSERVPSSLISHLSFNTPYKLMAYGIANQLRTRKDFAQLKQYIFEEGKQSPHLRSLYKSGQLPLKETDNEVDDIFKLSGVIESLIINVSRTDPTLKAMMFDKDRFLDMAQEYSDSDATSFANFMAGGHHDQGKDQFLYEQMKKQMEPKCESVVKKISEVACHNSDDLSDLNKRDIQRMSQKATEEMFGASGTLDHESMITRLTYMSLNCEEKAKPNSDIFALEPPSIATSKPAQSDLYELNNKEIDEYATAANLNYLKDFTRSEQFCDETSKTAQTKRYDCIYLGIKCDEYKGTISGKTFAPDFQRAVSKGVAPINYFPGNDPEIQQYVAERDEAIKNGPKTMAEIQDQLQPGNNYFTSDSTDNQRAPASVDQATATGEMETDSGGNKAYRPSLDEFAKKSSQDMKRTLRENFPSYTEQDVESMKKKELVDRYRSSIEADRMKKEQLKDEIRKAEKELQDSKYSNLQDKYQEMKAKVDALGRVQSPPPVQGDVPNFTSNHRFTEKKKAKRRPAANKGRLAAADMVSPKDRKRYAGILRQKPKESITLNTISLERKDINDGVAEYLDRLKSDLEVDIHEHLEIVTSENGDIVGIKIKNVNGRLIDVAFDDLDEDNQTRVMELKFLQEIDKGVVHENLSVDQMILKITAQLEREKETFSDDKSLYQELTQKLDSYRRIMAVK